MNQSGVVFAQGSQVNVGALIASAANITNQNFMAGRMVFDGQARPGAVVENHGTITVADRGLAALVGPRVTNTGLIQARLGKVALTGGAEAFTLDLAGDGMLAIDVTQAVRAAPSGNAALVTNSGVIEAPGGAVLISAHAASGLVEDMVRHTGRISANTEGSQQGRVALRATGGTVEIAGTVEARGAAQGQHGGRIDAQSAGGRVNVAAGARVDASGQAGGGAVQLGGRTTRTTRVAGEVTARGTGRGAKGGQVAVQAAEAVTVAATGRVDVSGAGGGGTALIGTEGIGRNQVMARTTTIEAGAAVHADALEAGRGGTIALNSTERTVMLGTLSATGGAAGGDGGFVELSGRGAKRVDGTVLLAGGPGGAGGTLLIDPDSIVIATGGTATIPPGGTITFGNDTQGTAIIIDPSQINNFTAGVTVVLQADNTITVSDAVNRATAGGLTLQATTGNITFDASVTLSNGVLTAEAGGSVLVNALLTSTGAAGGIDLRGTGGITIGADLNAGTRTVTLRSDGAVTQTPATAITAGTLTVLGATGANAGTVTLDQANDVASASVASSAGVSLRSIRAAGLIVTGLTAAANSTLRGDASLTLSGTTTVGTGNTLTLRSDGAIAQSGGTLTAGTLTVLGAANTTAGAVTLDLGNDIATASVASSAGVSLRSDRAGGLTVTSLDAGADSLVRADGDGGLSIGTATIGNAATLALQSNGEVSVTTAITATGGRVEIGAATSRPMLVAGPAPTPGTATFVTDASLARIDAAVLRLGRTTIGSTVDATTLTIAGTVTRPNAAAGTALELVGAAVAVNGTISFATADAANRVSIATDSFSRGAGVSIATGGAAPASGTVEIGPRAAQDLRITNAAAGGDLRVQPDDLDGAFIAAITRLGQTAIVPGVTATRITVDQQLDGGNALVTGRALELIAGRIDVDSAIDFIASDAANRITLRADTINIPGGGSIDVGAGLVIIEPLTDGRRLQVGGTVTAPDTALLLDAADLQRITAATGTLSLRSTGEVRLAEDLVLGAANAETLDLRGTAVSQTAGRLEVRRLTGQTVGATGSGDFGIDNAGAATITNVIDALGAISARGSIAIASVPGGGAPLAVSGAVVAGTEAGQAAPSITLRAPDLAIDTATGSLRVDNATAAPRGEIRLLPSADTTIALALGGPAVADAANVFRVTTGELDRIQPSGGPLAALQFGTGTGAAPAAPRFTAIGLDGSVDLRGGRGAALPDVDVLRLFAAGSLTQNQPALNVRRVEGALTGGALLDQAGNTVDSWALATGVAGGTPGNVRLINTVPIVIDAPQIAASDGIIEIEAPGSTTQAAIRLNAGLTTSGPNGRVLLRTGPSFDTPGTGSIVQAANAAISTARLSVSTSAGGGVAGEVLLNNVAGIRAANLGATAVTTPNQIGALVAGADRDGTPATAAVRGETIDIRSGATLGAPDATTAAVLTIAAPVVASSGDVVLAADDMAINAAVTGRDVQLTIVTPGRGITIGGTDSATLSLSAAELGNVTTTGAAGLLVIGSLPTPLPAARSDAAAGAIRQGSEALDLSTVAATLDLRSAVLIEQSGALAGNAGASLTVAYLSATVRTADRPSGNGPSYVWLGADNAIGVVGDFTGRALTAGIDLALDGRTFDLPVNGLANNAVTLRLAPGNALVLESPVSVAGVATQTGGTAAPRITLVADEITTPNTGTLLALGAAGTVELLPRTAGFAVDLGGAYGTTAAGTLTLDEVELARIDTGGGVLRIGRSGDAAVAGTATYAAIGGGDNDAVGSADAAADRTRLAGDITLRSALDLTAVAAQLELYAGVEGTGTGRITQDAGAALTVGQLAGASRLETILDQGNAIGRLAPREVLAAADTGIAFRAGTAATPPAEARFTLINAIDLEVTGAVSVAVAGRANEAAVRTGVIVLSAPSLTIDADLVAPPEYGAVPAIAAGGAAVATTSRVVLEATAGGIDQTGGRIVSGQLSAYAADGIDLARPENEIHALVAMGAAPSGTARPAGPGRPLDGADYALLAENGDIAFQTRLNSGAGAGIGGGGAPIAIDDGERALVIAAPVRAGPDGTVTRVVDSLAVEDPSAPTLVIGQGAGGRSISIRADDLDIRATIQAIGGEVALRAHATPEAGWGDVRLGGPVRPATGQALFLSGAELGLVDQGTPTLLAGDLLLAGGVTITGGDIRFESGFTLRGRGLRLQASGDVTQDGPITFGADLIDPRLLATLSGTVGGALALGDAGNSIAAVRDLSVAGDALLRTQLEGGAPLRIGGAAASRGIESGGAAVTIVADDLDIRALIALTAPGGTLWLAPLTAGRAVSLGSGTDIAGRLNLSRAELTRDGGANRIQFASDGLLRIGALGGDVATDPVTLGNVALAATGAITQGEQALDFAPASSPPNVTTLELRSAVLIEQSGALAGDPAASLTVANLSATVRTADRAGGDTSAAYIWLGADNAIGAVGDPTGRALGAGLTLALDRAVLDGTLPSGAITLRQAPGQGLAVDAPVQVTHTLAGIAGRVTLVADILAVGAAVSVPTDALSVIEVLPRTPGWLVQLGNGTTLASALHLDAAELDLLTTGGAGVLRIGRSADAAVAPIGGGDATLAGVAGADNTRLAGDIRLTGPVALGADFAQLELYAGVAGTGTGRITQDAGAALSVPRLAGASRLETLLGDAGNQVGELAARTVLSAADTGVSFRAGTAAGSPAEAGFTLNTALPLLTVSAEVSVGIGADGLVQQRGGTLALLADDMAITAPLRAPSGTVWLTTHAPATAPAAPLVDIGLGGGAGGLLLSAAELGLVDTDVAGPDGGGLLRIGSLAGDVLAGVTAMQPAGAIRQGGQAIDLTGSVRTLELRSAVLIEQSGALAGDPAASLSVANLSATVRTADRPNPADASPAYIWLGADNAIGTVGDPIRPTLGTVLALDPGITLALDRAVLDGTLPSGAITLRQAPGQGLAVDAPVQVTHTLAGIADRVTLIADSLAVGAAVGVPTDALSVIEVLPRTPGRLVQLGNGTTLASALHLDAAELDLLTTGGAGVLRIGRSADAAVAGLGALAPIGGGDATPAGVAGADNTRLAGDIRLTGPVTLGADFAQLELYAGVAGTGTGRITQDAGAALSVPRLAGASRLETLLGDAGNQVGELAARTVLSAADAGVSFRAGTAAGNAAEAGFTLRTALPVLTVSAEVSAGLAADGSVQQRGGTLALLADDMAITAPLRAPSGVVALTVHSQDRTIGLAGGAGGLQLSAAELDLVDTDVAGPDGGGLLRIGSLAGDPIAGTTAPVAGAIRQGAVDLDLTAEARTLELRGAGLIEQSSGALIVANLSARVRTADRTNPADTSPAYIWLGADNAIGAVGDPTGLALDPGITLALDGRSFALPGGTLANNAVTLRQAPGQALAVNDAITVAGGAIQTGASGAQAVGARITLMADSLAIAAPVTATSDILALPSGAEEAPGVVQLTVRTDGTGISFGSGAAAGLALDATELGLVSTAGINGAQPGLIRLGGLSDDAIPGFATAPVAGAILQTGAVDLTGQARTLELRSANRIEQADANAALIVPNLSAMVRTAERASGDTTPTYIWLGADNGIGAAGDPTGRAIAAGILLEADARIFDAATGGLANNAITIRQAPGGTLGATAPIRVAGPLSESAGVVRPRITLLADDLALAAAVTAAGDATTPGLIELLPRTAGRTVQLGNGTSLPSALHLDTAEIALLDSGGFGILRIGRSVDAAVTGGLLPAGQSETASTGAGPRTAGDIAFTGDAPLRSRFERLELFAGTEQTATGSITQSGGGIDVRDLAGEARFSATLDSTANTIDRLVVPEARAAGLPVTAAFLSGAATAAFASGLQVAPAQGGFTLATGNDLVVLGDVQSRGVTAPLTLLSGGSLTLGEGTPGSGATPGVASNAVSVRAGTADSNAGPFGRDSRDGTDALRLIAVGDIRNFGTAVGTGGVPGAPAPSLVQSTTGSILNETTASRIILGYGAPASGGGGFDAALDLRTFGELNGFAAIAGRDILVEAPGNLTLARDAQAGRDIRVDSALVDDGNLALGGLRAGGLVQAGRDVTGTGGVAAGSLDSGRSIDVNQALVAFTISAGANLSVVDRTAARDLRIQGLTEVAPGTILEATNSIETGTLVVDATGRVTTGTLSATTGNVENAGTVIATSITAAGDVLNSGRIEGAVIQTAGAGLEVIDSPSPIASAAAPPLPANGVLVETRRWAFNVIDQALSIDAGGAIRNQAGGVITTIAEAALPANYGNFGYSQIPGTPTLQDSALRLTAAGQVSNAAGAAMTATGPITIEAAGGIETGGRIESAGLVPGTSGEITLRATGGDIVQTGGLIASQGTGVGLTLRATSGDIVQSGGLITAEGTGALLTLRTDTGRIRQTGGALFATRRLLVQGGVGGALGGQNRIDELLGATFGAEGGTIRGQGSILVSGDIVSGGDLSLTAGGALAIGNGATTPAVTSGRGAVLTAEGGALTIGASVLQTAAGDLVLSGADGVTLSGTRALVQGSMRLESSGGGLTLAGVQAAVQGNLIGTAAGATLLNGVRAGVGGVLSISTPGSLAVRNSTLAANGGASTEGLSLLGDAGVTIDASSLFAANRLTIRDDRGVVIGGGTTLSGDSIYIESPVVQLGLVVAQVGTNILIQAPGGITNMVPFVVTPRTGGQLPAVIYDTRATPLQTADALLENIRPDLPGLASDQQPTQLRSAPGQEGPNPFFGPAVNAPAGPVVLNIEAGQSPVFLLLDGGTVTGTISAGRVAVHGTGGSAELTGQLSGLVGSEATRASDITRPVEPASLPNYRINSCVVGSINCVVPPRFVPIPPSVRTSVDFVFRPGQINPLDVTIPNTGENDYE